MTARYMFGLVREKFQVVCIVVAWVSVFVMDNLFGFEISPKVFFHYKSMFQDIATLAISIRNGMRMVGGINQNISVRAFLAPPFPGWGIWACFAIIGVILASYQIALAVHRIILTGYISVVSWVRISAVASRDSTTYRAITLFALLIDYYLFSAIGTVVCGLGLIAISNMAIPRTKSSSLCKAGLERKGFSTLFAYAFNLIFGTGHSSSCKRNVMFAGIIS